MQYPPSELVLNDKKQVYHLGIDPEVIANKIILVGDQGRVEFVSALFDTIEHKAHHREFVTHTGTYKGKRICVISTGIGTDNLDIVMNEIDALVNIDLDKREDKAEKKSLDIVRIGTCGILRPEIPVHSYILSSYSFGLDNIAHFYEMDFTTEENQLQEELSQHLQMPEKITPYMVKADEGLVQRMSSEKTHAGITVTSSGFYGPQGRQLRLKLSTQDLNERLGSFESGSLRVMNFEMESSALFVLGKNLGHKCTTICLGIANRPKKEFSKGYETEMKDLIHYVLERI